MSNNADDIGPLYNQGRVITFIEQMPHVSPEVKKWAKTVKLWPGVAPAVAKQQKKNNKNNTVPDVYVPLLDPPLVVTLTSINLIHFIKKQEGGAYM